MATGLKETALKSGDFLTKGSVLRAGGAKLGAYGVDEIVALCDITFKSGDVFCGESDEIEEMEMGNTNPFA